MDRFSPSSHEQQQGLMGLGAALDLLKHEGSYLAENKNRSHFGTSEALTAIGAAIKADLSSSNTSSVASPGKGGSLAGGVGVGVLKKSQNPSSAVAQQPKVVVLADDDDESKLLVGAASPTDSNNAVAVAPDDETVSMNWAAQDVNKYAHLTAAITKDTIRQQQQQNNINNKNIVDASPSSRGGVPPPPRRPLPTTLEHIVRYSALSDQNAETAAYAVAHFLRTADGVSAWLGQLKKLITTLLLHDTNTTSNQSTINAQQQKEDHAAACLELFIFLGALLKVWSPFAVIAPDTFNFLEFLLSQAVPWLLQYATRSEKQTTTVGADNEHHHGASSSVSIGVDSFLALHCALMVVEGAAQDMTAHSTNGNLQHYLGPNGDELVWRHLRGQCVATVQKVFGFIVPPTTATGAGGGKGQTTGSAPHDDAARLFALATNTLLSGAILSPLYEERAAIRAGAHKACEADRAAAAQQGLANSNSHSPMQHTLEAIAALVRAACGTIADVCKAVREVLELVLALQVGGGREAYDPRAVIRVGLRGHLVGLLQKATAAHSNMRRGKNEGASSSSSSPSLLMEYHAAMACLGIEAAILMGMGGGASCEDGGPAEEEEEEEDGDGYTIPNLWYAILGYYDGDDDDADGDAHHQYDSPLLLQRAALDVFTAVIVDDALRGTAHSLAAATMAAVSGADDKHQTPSTPSYLLSAGAASVSTVLSIVGEVLTMEKAAMTSTNQDKKKKRGGGGGSNGAAGIARVLSSSSTASVVAEAWFGFASRLSTAKGGSNGNSSAKTKAPVDADVEKRALGLLRLLSTGTTAQTLKMERDGGGGGTPSFLSMVLIPATVDYPHLFLGRWCNLVVDTACEPVERCAGDALRAVIIRIGMASSSSCDNSNNAEGKEGRDAVALRHQLVRYLIASLSSSPRQWGTAAQMVETAVGSLIFATMGQMDHQAHDTAKKEAAKTVQEEGLMIASSSSSFAATIVEELAATAALRVPIPMMHSNHTAARDSGAPLACCCAPSTARWLRWLAHPSLMGIGIITAMVQWAVAWAVATRVAEANGQQLAKRIVASNAADGPVVGSSGEEGQTKAPPRAAQQKAAAFTSPADIGIMWCEGGVGGGGEQHDEGAKEEGTDRSATSPSSATILSECIAIYLLGGDGEEEKRVEEDGGLAEGLKGRIRAVSAEVIVGGASSSQLSMVDLFEQVRARLLENGNNSNNAIAQSFFFAECVACSAGEAMQAKGSDSVNGAQEEQQQQHDCPLASLIEASLTVMQRQPQQHQLTSPRLVTALLLPALRETLPSCLPRPLRRACAEVLCDPRVVNPQWWITAAVGEALKALRGVMAADPSSLPEQKVGGGGSSADPKGVPTTCTAASSTVDVEGFKANANTVLKWLHCLCRVLAEIVFVGGHEKKQQMTEEEKKTQGSHNPHPTAIHNNNSEPPLRRFTAADIQRGWLAAIGPLCGAVASDVYRLISTAADLSSLLQRADASAAGPSPFPPPAAVMAACRDFTSLYTAAKALLLDPSSSSSSQSCCDSAELMPSSVHLNYLFFLSRVTSIIAAADDVSGSNGDGRSSSAPFLLAMQQPVAAPSHPSKNNAGADNKDKDDDGACLYLTLLARWKACYLDAVIQGAGLVAGGGGGVAVPPSTIAEQQHCVKVLFSFIAQTVKAKSAPQLPTTSSEVKALVASLALSASQRDTLHKAACGGDDNNNRVPVETQTLLMSVLPML